MIWHFAALGVLAIFITLGFFYRLSALLFFVGFTYIFLLEQARYLNHFYLISLLSFLLIFLPAHRLGSVDVWRRPKLLSQTVPAWTLWLLRFQIGVPYFYGGLAKLNSDWLQGEPMGMWLAKATDFPLVGHLFTKGWMVHLLSYSGLILDLLVVPLLLWRKTRWFAFVFAVAFHLTNARIFTIGIFPWFMIAATALFFPPDWPRRAAEWWFRASTKRSLKYASKRRLNFSALKTSISQDERDQLNLTGSDTDSFQDWQSEGCNHKPFKKGIPYFGAITSKRYQSAITVCLLAYASLQCLLPFRHYLYPGNVSWTEEGHKFAWHMKLRDKKGTAEFLVRDPTTQQVQSILPEQILPNWQARKLARHPDMVMQFAHYLAETLPVQGDKPLEVRARVLVSLNGRPPQPMVNPFVDLAKEKRSLGTTTWILPLNEPLKQASSP